MRLLIIVSQMFYDLIARVLPGFFFLLVVSLGWPDLALHLLMLVFGAANNARVSVHIGGGLATIGLSYMLGWVFSGFVTKSFESPTYEQASAKNTESQLLAQGERKSLEAMGQWIRLFHPPVGFRIVKRKAEARLLETSRMAMTFVMGLAVFHGLLLLYMRWGTDRPFSDMELVRPVVILATAWLLRRGFHRCEKRAWEKCWADTCGMYEILQGQ